MRLRSRWWGAVFATFLSVFATVSALASEEMTIQGVPLPKDAVEAEGDSPFASAFVGRWDGVRETILVVEDVVGDGTAKVLYGIAPFGDQRPGAWLRYGGTIDGNTLTVTGEHATTTFTLTPNGRLRAVFGDGFAFAVLRPIPLATLFDDPEGVSFSTGESLMLETTLVEDGKAVALETVVFSPAGDGPFPLAVVNHGSTGYGNDPDLFGQTWTNPWLAETLTERGYLVAFPQRRGRGRSDGLYDEGFTEDRRHYTCEKARSLKGADRALGDIDAAIAALRMRKDVAEGPLLLSGHSRGGALSVAYAGLHAEDVAGVVNFVGGWMGDGCPEASAINQTLLNKGAAFQKPMLWLYGHDDLYYGIDHNRDNVASFRNAGGTAAFEEVRVRGENNGHYVIAIPPLWEATVDAYLNEIGAPPRH
ncbi:MAG: alpha/beta hydrolase [Devosia sp.]